MKKPSHFKNKPFLSIVRDEQAEEVALRIMKYLAGNGDTFRGVSWREYFNHRIETDGAIELGEKDAFASVVSFTHSANAALVFSPNW